MVKKSDMVRELVSCGKYKEALAIAKGFKLGITKEQSDAMVRAYECMVHERFYRSIGTDIEGAIDKGISILKDLYGRGNEIAIHKQIPESRA